MGDMDLYGFGSPYPLVDHPHERTHQHQTIWRYLSHKGPDPKNYPNYPDVDIRDATGEYLVEIEVPGIKDSSEITCEWISLRRLVVSGSVGRPGSVPAVEQEGETGTRDAHGDFKPPKPHEPYLLVGERRIGPFRRNFYFPADVEMEKMSAKLEAGLLRLRIPKREEYVPQEGGKINIEVHD